ncbi:MAG: hypothetical protein HC767_14695 [Akkermansiaceae bacterium]|nr:hypothetical protein [Akkermansiaceae bacterium]
MILMWVALQYEVNLQMPSASTPLALEVILQPSEGDADLIVFNLDGGRQQRLGISQQVGTGMDQVYVDPKNIPAGSNITVQIYPDGESATFTMTIEVLEEGNGTISDRDAQVLPPLS